MPVKKNYNSNICTIFADEKCVKTQKMFVV